ncbi:YD repeat-containing protein [Sphingobium sp. YR657]|uniref:RHS repeat domain-containing protein n=1 Tax=Sphingobium sp. YR657 TaxID=1884366 RepID=UPI0009116017|nr:RHS repeat domain-containing protein [Sphingobium sp. YR657]SHM56451.1 YD repeat-containing protein [Sphingobium sp. YR657]
MGQKHSIARHAALGFLLSTVGHCLMFASGGATAMAANPAVVIPTAPLVTPANALSYYGTPVSPTPPASRDPIVAEAARSLRYDVDTIYAFVRDNVRLTPVFGLQKGARGVVLDGYGTAFDQAQFMVDTLREADAVAAKGYNPVYKMGTITLSAAQFSAWTGISDAAVAGKFLGNGGIPATVSGSGASFTVSMLHIWVQVTIDGANYLFDPSFKPSTSAPGLSWQSQTGYDQATLLAAGGGATATTVNGFNIINFRAKLKEYRANLETYLASNAAGQRAEAVVGDDVITAHASNEDRRTSLPYVNSTDRSWSGQIPTVLRTAFTVKLNGDAYGTYYADEEGGETLGFTYSYSSGAFRKGSQLPSPVIASSFLDACDQYLSNKANAASPAVASVDINHPYAANSGGYADRTISRQIVSQVCASGRFFVSNDWGFTGNGVSERMAPVAAQIRSDPNRPTDFTFGPTIANVASQYSSFLDLAAKAQSSIFQVHDLIGIHALDNVAFNVDPPNSMSLSTSPSMSFEAAVSGFGRSGTTASDVTAAYAAGLGLSYAEGAVPRQETDSVYDMAALSLVTQQDVRATSAGTYTTYLANPTASPSWASVQGSLSGYPTGSTAAATAYSTEGYSLLIPQRGALRQPRISVQIGTSTSYRIGSMWEGSGPGSTASEITRSAFLAWHPSAGAGSVPDRIALVLYDQRRGSILKAAVGVPIQTGTDASPVRKPDAPKVESKDFIRAALSVDGRSGALSYAPASDLTDGAGDFPRSLSLQRVYSQRDQTNYGFGMGWKSNWYQVATMSNDGQLALGNGGAQAVASALVAIQAMGDLTTTQDAQHLYAALQTASWLTDQTINNSIVVSRGLDPDHAFYAQASGNFVSAKADGASLTMTGSPSTGIINRRVYLDTSFAFTDRDGSVRTYPNLSATPIDISSPGIASAYTRKFVYMDQWAFPNGIKVNAAYVSTLQADVYYLFRAYNNLGASIKSFDYNFGSATDFPYCTVNGGVVYYDPPYPAKISYRTPSRSVSFGMDAQVGWQLTVDPDGARCAAGTKTPPMRQLQYISYLRTGVDPTGNGWPVGYSNVGGMFGTTTGLSRIYKPSNITSPDITVTYGGDGNVRSFTNPRGNSWNYFSTPFRSESVSPLQAATPGRGSVTYYDQYGQATRSVDPLLRTTATSYDNAGRPLLVTQPEGNAVLSAYDVRGNVISQTQQAKPGSGLVDLVTTTVYAEGAAVLNCVNIVTCNKPIYTIDPRGFRSDYGWDASTGMPLSVRQGWNSAGTACQIGAGGGCPSVAFGYGSGLTGFDPFEGISSGPIYLPQTQVEAAESGTTTTAYGYTLKTFTSTYAPLSGHNVRKLVPTQVTVDSGGLNLVTCFDYDDAGNIISDRSPRGGGTCP